MSTSLVFSFLSSFSWASEISTRLAGSARIHLVFSLQSGTVMLPCNTRLNPGPAKHDAATYIVVVVGVHAVIAEQLHEVDLDHVHQVVVGLADGDGAHHAVHLPALSLALPLPPPGPGEGVLDVHDLISDVLQVGVIRGADLREARM